MQNMLIAQYDGVASTGQVLGEHTAASAWAIPAWVLILVVTILTLFVFLVFRKNRN